MNLFFRPILMSAVAAAIVVGSAGAARAQTCAAACPNILILTLGDIEHSEAVAGPVSGFAATGLPTRDKDPGRWVYELRLTARQASDVAIANAMGCESVVTYRTTGDVFADGDSTAVVTAEIVTKLVRGGRVLPLDVHDVDEVGPPSLPIGGSVETPNLTPGLVGVQEGDRLVVDGTAWAFARARGAGSGDNASADLRMPLAGATGSPLFKICVP